MSQTSVTRHYNIRKRNVSHVEVPKLPQHFAQDGIVKIDLVKEGQNVKAIPVPKTVKCNLNSQKSGASIVASKKKNPAPAKKGKKPTAANDKKQSSIKTFLTTESNKPKNEKTKNVKAKNCPTSCIGQDRVSSPFKITVESPSHSLQQSPKRNHPSPSDEGTPSKKKHLEESVSSVTEAQTINKPKGTSRRKLKLDSLSGQSNPDIQSPEAKLVTASPQKNLQTPDKLDALVDQSRIKLINSPKRDELKKALQVFSKKTAKLKELQSNPYMVNCIASSSKSVQKKKEPPIDARKRFNYLTQPDSLVLPFKYQVLSEMFRSMDSLVATMHNMKQNIIFDKVKKGVQNIMKRNFGEKELGQIVTIFPSAYNLSREKVSYICKENGSPEHQLIITLNFNNTDKGSNKKSAAFQHISPDFLKSRINEFNKNLLELVKKHHQDFLTRINFVPKDNVFRWHPKFPVDSMPDIPMAQLPKSPEMKIYTATGVLNKFTRSFRNKVGKALQSVSEETEKLDVTFESKKLNISRSSDSKELKGICVDLLEKIRGKESQKLLKTMTQTPAETNQLAMLERVPKIVNILFLYFISERKPALPVNKVVDKITHSFSSLSTPGEVEEHLKLIQKQFPFWLNFVQISKGDVYLTVNRSTNINEMLDRAGLH